MLTTPDFFHLAAKFHRALPDRIREYLHARGISDEIIDRRLLGWNGWRIMIPVFNRNGVCAFFRLAKDPDDTSDAPKMLSLRGSQVDLYGWEVLRLNPKRIIICEGEFDRLVLEANGFEAITSTGGAGTFKPEWIEAFAEIPEVYVCFDRDYAGRQGALRVAGLIGHAKIVELPEEVGPGGDVTDFFVRLAKTSGDFESLLSQGQSAPPEKPVETTVASNFRIDPVLRERIEKIKREIAVESVIDKYLELKPSGSALMGLCPFHEDHYPSFAVYSEKRNFHCFGCGAHGDVLNFLQRVEHLSFRQALDMLEGLQSDGEARPQ
jgi:DNA primase